MRTRLLITLLIVAATLLIDNPTRMWGDPICRHGYCLIAREGLR